ncbi:MAG: hypothetical protein U1F36_01500 [Planctomycetota bacterium]
MARLLHALAASLALALPSLVAQDQKPAAAPRSPIESLGLGKDIDWIADPEVFVDSARPQRNIRRDVDRSALLSSALERAKESHRLVMWYVPRIVEGQKHGVQMYRAPVLDTYAMQLLFEDPDLVALVRSRFVALRLNLDEALAARYGLRPLEFVEPAIVFLDQSGTVVHFVERIRTFDPHWFVELMRRVLDKSDKGADDAAITDPQQALAEGRYARAASLISGLRNAPGRKAYLEAQLARRLRDLGAAERAFDAAAKTGDAPADIAVDRIRTLLLAGHDAQLPKSVPEGCSRAAEGNYLLALAALRAGDEDAAREGFAAVAKQWPDSPFGRRAAANVLLGDDERPVGAAFSGFETMHWMDAAAYEGLPRDTERHGPPLEPKEIAVRGVRQLLELQRKDGGFKDSRYAYWPSPKITPNAWIAITALAATALFEYRDVAPEQIPTATIDAAVARAENYLFDPSHLARGENEDVYADTYRLLYLARRHAKADATEKTRLVGLMNGIVGEARKRQDENGFFAHEYANAFCTGAMLWGLLRARESGAEVPEEMFSRGVAALVSARANDGSFGYGGTGRSTLKDASERMPLCEGILFALARSDGERLRFAFDNYWKNIGRIEQVRRNDFHSDGELAGFMFFHGLFHASEIFARLPQELRGDARGKFLDLLQRVAEVDSTYLDSHEIGRSYATATALLTLANLRERD